MRSFFQPDPSSKSEIKLPLSRYGALTAVRTSLAEAGVFNLIIIQDEATGCAEEIRYVPYNHWLLNFSSAPQGAISISTAIAGNICFKQNKKEDFDTLVHNAISSLDELLKIFDNIAWYLQVWESATKLEQQQKEKKIYPMTNFSCDVFIRPMYQYLAIKSSLKTLQQNILSYFKLFIEKVIR